MRKRCRFFGLVNRCHVLPHFTEANYVNHKWAVPCKVPYLSCFTKDLFHLKCLPVEAVINRSFLRDSASSDTACSWYDGKEEYCLSG